MMHELLNGSAPRTASSPERRPDNDQTGNGDSNTGDTDAAPHLSAEHTRHIQHIFCAFRLWGGEKRAQLIRALTASPVDQVALQAAIGALTRAELARAQDELSTLIEWGVSYVPLLDPRYPPRLRAIPDPPLALYVKGAPEVFPPHFAGKYRSIFHSEAPAVALVGTRRASLSGVHFTEMLARDLAAGGAVVVSGLARGIDTAAHSGAVAGAQRAPEGRGCAGIAVLGGGFEHLSPRENEELANRLIRGGGALVSEYYPLTVPTRYTFPERNRIIAGLADVTVVVEAGARSGALITARCAAEQGREVFAVPGALHAEGSVGVNALLRDGARIFTERSDLFALLPNFTSNSTANHTPPGALPKSAPRVKRAPHKCQGHAPSAPNLTPSSGPPAGVSLQLLSFIRRNGPTHIDELACHFPHPTSELTELLSLLELDGYLIRLTPSTFMHSPP